MNALRNRWKTAAALLSVGSFVVGASIAHTQPTISLSKVGGYDHGALGAAEIVAHDPASQRMFVVNALAATIDILDINDPTAPILVTSVDVSPYGAVANSVDVHDGVVAVAVENSNKQANGVVAFFDTDGNHIKTLTVGALPDMVVFSRNGKYLLVANEGEPNATYTVDPAGTVSIIDMRGNVANMTQSSVRTVGFSQFNSAVLDPSIRIFGPGATVAQDLEPEYITISDDSKTAWVTLQENNAVAIIDIKHGVVERLVGLGFKDHSIAGNGMDASDRDGPSNTPAINITTWPVKGMYLPDAIASYKHHGGSFIVLANEGDAREYTAFDEQTRVGSIALDPVRFPNAAALKTNAQLGRLRITRTRGNTDTDAEFEELYSFGARSFTIRDANGTLVYDSGDDLEQITALALPAQFNANSEGVNTFDTRSDDKGPEPEGLAIGKLHGDHYAFVGLERIGGIAVFNIEVPTAPVFVQYINTRDFSVNGGGDVGPEGLHFIAEDDSPTDSPLLIVGNEISGTSAIYEITSSGTDDDDDCDSGDDNNLKRSLGSTTTAPGVIAPNPATGKASVTYSLVAQADVEIDVVDARGASVLSIAKTTRDAGSFEAAVDVTSIDSGAYYVLFRVDGIVREIRPLRIVH